MARTRRPQLTDERGREREGGEGGGKGREWIEKNRMVGTLPSGHRTLGDEEGGVMGKEVRHACGVRRGGEGGEGGSFDHEEGNTKNKEEVSPEQ